MIALVEGYITALGNLACVDGGPGRDRSIGGNGGEEAAGTVDLLLAQPLRRTSLILGKAAGLAACITVVDLAAIPGFVVGNLHADLSISTMEFAAAAVSGLPAVLIFLACALLAGALLPGRGWAAMVASTIVVAAYFVNAAGAIGPLQTLRKVSPFYWADASHVLIGGFDVVRTAAMTAIAAVLLLLASWAFERRDISSGSRESGSLWRQAVRLLPSQPGEPRGEVRLGVRLSTQGIMRKTAQDARALTIGASMASFLFALLLVLIYPAYRDALKDFEYPGVLSGLLGEAGSIASPNGFIAAEYFGFVPLIVTALAIILGTGATAAEEAAGTLDLLLAQPVRRATMLQQKALAMAVAVAVTGGAGVPGFLFARVFVEMDVSTSRFVGATGAMILLSLVYLAGALLAGATFPSPGPRRCPLQPRSSPVTCSMYSASRSIGSKRHVS